MLNDGAPFSRIYLKVGRTDLRKGIDGLATIVKTQIHLDPFQKNVLFLFCGRSPTKIKGLLWEGDGFLGILPVVMCAAIIYNIKLRNMVYFFC